MKKRFELAFTREFLKKLRGLDRQAQIRILRELRVLEENPLIGKHLVGRLSGYLSLRIGEYRVIYQISGIKVIVWTVGHRRAVYEG